MSSPLPRGSTCKPWTWMFVNKLSGDAVAVPLSEVAGGVMLFTSRTLMRSPGARRQVGPGIVHSYVSVRILRPPSVVLARRISSVRWRTPPSLYHTVGSRNVSCTRADAVVTRSVAASTVASRCRDSTRRTSPADPLAAAYTHARIVARRSGLRPHPGRNDRAFVEHCPRFPDENSDQAWICLNASRILSGALGRAYIRSR